MTEGLLSVLAQSGHPAIAAACLDAMPHDELGEIDLVNDQCRNIHHAAGKYFVPITDGSLTSLCDYTVDNMVHPDDRNVFAQLFDPDTLAQRLAASAVPGVISARFRYRLQAGGWRWTEVFLLGDGHQGQPAGIVRFYIIDIENIVAREQNASLDQDGHPDRESLPDQARFALADAKADFRKRICLFRQPMRERMEHDYLVLSEFQRALDTGEIFFQLQPQCQVSTGKIVGAEALARWRKPDGALVAPLDFVPVLESHGFIANLDAFIWEETCIWLRSLIDAGRTAVPVSVNVSQVDFYMLDVPECFVQLVREYNLPASLLKVEITESAYADNTAVIGDATQRLRYAGFLVLMDDFGSGNSSLHALDSLNVDVLKLDADFLRIGDSGSAKGVRILESVISMARLIDLPIICEGVETDEQVEMLEQRGCRFVQGYRFFRPMNVEDFEALIADENMIDAGGFDNM